MLRTAAPAFLFLAFLFLAACSSAAASDCAPRLWPAGTAFSLLSAPLRDDLLREARRLEPLAPRPVAVLISAGVVALDDPRLVASRAALADANRAAILALASRVTGEKHGLAATRAMLNAWARVHAPSGHPIDESKLDQMVWAYDLVRCDLAREDRELVELWFRNVLEKKDAWRFGPASSRNNHRTHQLKLQMLIAAALGDGARLERYQAQARDHASINIDARDGTSHDYRERDALHYHAFNLEAWSEIELVGHCCAAPVAATASFLWRKIAAGDVDHQFASSEVAIDRRRAEAGHTYLAERYDSARAARAALAFYTGRCPPTDPIVQTVLDAATQEPRYLFFALRRALWNTSLVC